MTTKLSIAVGEVKVNGKRVGGISGFAYEGPAEGLGAALDLHRGIESRTVAMDDELYRDGRRLHDPELLDEHELAEVRAARALKVGDRVRVISGKFKDREGIVSKVLEKVVVQPTAFVTLDRKPRERTTKTEPIRVEHLQRLATKEKADAVG